MSFRITRYALALPGVAEALSIAIVADLHNRRWESLRDTLLREAPDLILLPGDLFDAVGKTARAEEFLAWAASFRPTFFSLGNHDVRALSPAALSAISEHTGATLLHNSSVFYRGLCIGGLSSGYTHGGRQSRLRTPPPPDTAFLDRYEGEAGFHLLLCHHPEYYDRYIAPRAIPLSLAGHAHGGQWSLGRQGLFAPGQGLFPRYTAGLYHGRLLVSRGLAMTRRYFLRIGNPRELVLLTLSPAAE